VHSLLGTCTAEDVLLTFYSADRRKYTTTHMKPLSVPGMRDCSIAGAEENTLPSSKSFWTPWQQYGASYLDTAMFQSEVFRDMSLNAVQVAVWSTVKNTVGNESRLGNPAAVVISNVTSEVSRASHVGSTMGGLTWVLVLAVIILVISCILCSTRTFELDFQGNARSSSSAQRTTTPEPLVSASAIPPPPDLRPRRVPTTSGSLNPRAAPTTSGSHASLPFQGSSGSPSAAASLPTSARSMKAGKALSMKIKSNASSAACLSGTKKTLSRPDITPHSSLSMYTFQDPVGQSKGGSRFTMSVDALVDVAKNGSFIIKDTLSSLVLRAAVSQNLDGSRKVQVFLAEDALTPLASVEPTPMGSQPVFDSLVIRGPNNVHLGNLVLQATGSFVVHAHEQPELVIDGNEEDLDLHISSRDGSSKATVSCKENLPGEPEQIEINVLPGTDAVLIVACTLAILFLCGEV